MRRMSPTTGGGLPSGIPNSTSRGTLLTKRFSEVESPCTPKGRVKELVEVVVDEEELPSVEEVPLPDGVVPVAEVVPGPEEDPEAEPELPPDWEDELARR